MYYIFYTLKTSFLEIFKFSIMLNVFFFKASCYRFYMMARTKSF